MVGESFVLIYWLNGQSKLFSEPWWFETEDVVEFNNAVEVALENGYEIDYAGAI